MNGALTAARIEELRKSFDEAFSRPAEDGDGELEDLIAIRVAGDAFALRLSDLAAVHGRCRVTELPGSTPALLGISSLRGRLAGVYDLARILGYGAGGEPRWLAVCRADGSIALSLSDVEGYVRVPRAELCAVGVESGRSGHVDRAFEHAAGAAAPIVRAILYMPALIDTVRRSSARVSGAEAASPGAGFVPGAPR